MPINCRESNFLKWLDSRDAAKHRAHLSAYLHSIGCDDIIGFLRLTHGISLNDCYWVKESAEDITWDKISPYRNDYSEVIQK